MADTAARLYGPTALGTSATTIYTSAASTTTIVRHIIVCNTTTAASAFYLSIGADAVGTRLFHKYPVEGTTNGISFFEWKGFVVLAAAETLQAFADDATTLTLTVNGIKIT